MTSPFSLAACLPADFQRQSVQLFVLGKTDVVVVVVSGGGGGDDGGVGGVGRFYHSSTILCSRRADSLHSCRM